MDKTTQYLIPKSEIRRKAIHEYNREQVKRLLEHFRNSRERSQRRES